MRRIAAALVVALGSVVLLAGAAVADTPPAPKLAFTGRAKPVLHLVDRSGRASVTVAISNTGDTAATGLRFLLLQDGSAAVEACEVRPLVSIAEIAQQTCVSKPDPVTLAAGATSRFALTFRIAPSGLRGDPLIEVQSVITGVAPAFTEPTTSRSLSDQRLWWPVYGALLGVVLFILLGVFATRKAANRDPAPAADSSMRARIWSWAIAKTFTAAPWSFKDSWATNVAAFGGALGGVLGSTGFFADVLPGVSAGRFTGFSLAFAGLAALAPIVYTATSRRETDSSITVGTVAGLLTASAVVVASIAGELTTIGLLVWMSEVSSRLEVVCFAGLVVAGITVIVYAVRSARWLSVQKRPKQHKAALGEEALLTTLSSAPSGYGVVSAGVP